MRVFFSLFCFDWVPFRTSTTHLLSHHGQTRFASLHLRFFVINPSKVLAFIEEAHTKPASRARRLTFMPIHRHSTDKLSHFSFICVDMKNLYRVLHLSFSAHARSGSHTMRVPPRTAIMTMGKALLLSHGCCWSLLLVLLGLASTWISPSVVVVALPNGAPECPAGSGVNGRHMEDIVATGPLSQGDIVVTLDGVALPEGDFVDLEIDRTYTVRVERTTGTFQGILWRTAPGQFTSSTLAAVTVADGDTLLKIAQPCLDAGVSRHARVCNLPETELFCLFSLCFVSRFCVHTGRGRHPSRQQ